MALSNEDRELAFTPAHRLKELIKQKKLSPVELLEAILRRIEEINPKIDAYLTLAQEQAYEAAHKAERAVIAGNNLGPLHGIPVSIKDLKETKGIRTTYGSTVLRHNIPQSEGPLMKRLREAGAIIIGKTNTPECGLTAPTENNLAVTRNPWNTERSPGGSSGGAGAAVAAGISPLAEGSDGGGSIRIPSALCGVFGLKATNGRVPLDVHDWGISPVSCYGPMTRNVRDAAMMLNVIAGPDKSDYTCIRTPAPDYLKALDSKMGTLRIAWSLDMGYGTPVGSEVATAFRSAVKVFDSLGHRTEEAAPKTAKPFETWSYVYLGLCYQAYGFLFDHLDEITDYARANMELARNFKGTDVNKAWMEVERIRGAVLNFFEEYDLLLTPVTANPALKIGAYEKKLEPEQEQKGFFSPYPFLPVFNLSRNPAASIPCGFSSEGLPIGLQIVGRLQDEVTVLQASAAFEQARPWADKYPPVS